jgi:hypothetical protein
MWILSILIWFPILFQPDSAVVRIENQLDLPRAEVISIKVADLEKILESEIGDERISVQDSKTGKLVITQFVDLNQDGIVDELLFWSEIGSKEIKTYQIRIGESKLEEPKENLSTFARFVPERIDDIAWENDKVAFRTYGPEAQRLTDEGMKGGTLTSGIDAWLKRVDYPIIDRWYQKHVDGRSYHKDAGEGYDPYHVGDSRGIGGIGVLLDDSLYVSKNFVDYKILTTGKLRTIFQLTYAPWQAGKARIQESKIISIDRGSQFFKMEIESKSSEKIPNVTAGITLHEGNGVTEINRSQGWISYWEMIDDAGLGTGLVMAPKLIKSAFEKRTSKKDQSHLFVSFDPKKKINYYAGFAWQKAGEIQTKKEWTTHLSEFSQKVNSPLRVKLALK